MELSASWEPTLGELQPVIMELSANSESTVSNGAARERRADQLPAVKQQPTNSKVYSRTEYKLQAAGALS